MRPSLVSLLKRYPLEKVVLSEEEMEQLLQFDDVVILERGDTEDNGIKRIRDKDM